MNHNEIRHMLSEYIDGAVSPGDRAAIEAHLKTCETCSAALKELRQTVAQIKSIEELDPPAWMTQKIMAKVRVEAAKKSWFQRLFFPLHVKLPLEAIGVLFIAVTAVFIYQNREPAMMTSSPALQDQMPAQGPLPNGIAKNEERRSVKPLRRSNEMPQSPGYKALDMKQEYEKPAPPMLQDQAAPAPSFSKSAEQPAVMAPAEKKEAFSATGESDQTVLRKEAGRGMMRERTTTAAGAAPETAAKAKAIAPAASIAGALSADKAIPGIILHVMDIPAAVKEIERTIEQVKGSIVRRETSKSKTTFFVKIKAERTGEFKSKLKLLGEIKEQPGELGIRQEQVELRLEIMQRASQP
jgi:anti-sigma factor RsiW